MARIDDDLTGKSLGVTIRREYISHDDGELTHEQISAFSELFDGTTHKEIDNRSVALTCGHPTERGLDVAVCEECSREQKRTAFVCHRCACNCAFCGENRCVKHCLRAADEKLYCPKCYKKLFGEGLGIGRLLAALGRPVRTLARWW